MEEKRLFRHFWMTMAAAVTVFFALMLTNEYLVTSSAPHGMTSHQSAWNASTVDAIQQSWEELGVFRIAGWFTAADYVFIMLFTLAGILHGRYVWYFSRYPLFRKLALFEIFVLLLCGLSDFIETTLQAVQMWTFAGDDILAFTAAVMQKVKITCAAIAIPLLVGLLAFNRHEASA
jgi:hypothetical protein